MSDCKSYVSKEDLQALKESQQHIEHVARSRNAAEEKASQVTDPIRGENVTNRTLDGLEDLYTTSINNFETRGEEALLSVGWVTVDSFQQGAEITERNQVLSDETTGEYYRWDGTLPKTVPSGSTPESAGGVGMGAWVSVGDASLRGDLSRSSGAGLIGTESGNTVQGEIDEIKNILDYIPQRCSHAANKLADGGNLKIECYGDSTMYGSTANDTTVQNPVNMPGILQVTMNQIYGGGRVTVLNKAIPGTALVAMIAGTDGSGSTFDEKMKNSDADIVYCNHAQNDCNSFWRNAEEFKGDVVTFVNTVRKYGKVPVLVTPNVTFILGGITDKMTMRLPAFVDVIRSVAKSMNVDIVDNFYYTSKATRLLSGSEIVPDGVHLSTVMAYQCGANLSIPLIAAKTLSMPGDLTGLSNVTYNHDITSGLNIGNIDNIFSKQISWKAESKQQGIWFPFILDNPTDDTTLSISGYQWADGGKTIIEYKGSFDDEMLGGWFNQKREDIADPIATYSPNRCRLLPGLHVLRLVNHSDNDGVYSSFSGIKLIKRDQIAQPGDRSVLITSNNKVLTNIYIVKDDVIEDSIVEIKAFNGNQVNAMIYNNKGDISILNSDRASTHISNFNTGLYNLELTFNKDNTITVNLGGFIVTSQASSFPLSTCFIGKNNNLSLIRSN